MSPEPLTQLGEQSRLSRDRFWKIMAFLYIIKSIKDGSFYVGSSKNVEHRLIDHNIRSTNKYTTKKRPWKIVYTREYKTINEAIKEEKRLKKCKSKKYLEWLIKKGPLAQLGEQLPLKE